MIIEIVKPRIPNQYIKVPKELILQTDLSEHRISVLNYFNYNRTYSETVHYSPNFMIEWCGYKPNWRKLKNNKENIYEKFSKCMNWFYENDYILNFDSEKYIQNTFQSSLINKKKLLPSSNFGIVYDFEIEAIMNYKSPYRPLNYSVILLVLSYIRAYTWIRATQSEKSKNSKPEIFHSHFTVMEKYLSIKAKLISKATDILNNMKIIKTYRMPNYQDYDGQWHTDEIIFICPYKISTVNNAVYICDKDTYDWEKELEYGILYLRNMNHTSKKFYQD